MRRSALLVVFSLVATPALAQPRDATARCREACERHVKDPRLRASACGACLLAPGDAAAWLPRLPSAPEGLLDDPDWQVRWAALLASARAQGGTAPQALGAWLARARGDERLRACQTALHAAGALKLSLDALLEPARAGLPAADPRCRALVPALLDAEASRLYAVDPVEQNEALRHTAVALGRSPGRLTLDAMATRPAGLDAAALAPLLRWTEAEGTALGAELVRAAGPGDVTVMNRALAVASRLKDEAAVDLRGPDDDTRKRGVRVLANLAPWSEAELLLALADPLPAIRLRAARGLAWGEGRALGPTVAARLAGERPATSAQRLALLALLVDTSDPACAEVALATWHDEGREPPLRRAALAAAAACHFETAAAAVTAALARAEPLDRAAGVRALGFAPKEATTRARLASALEAAEAPVRQAACEAVAQGRQRALAPALQPRAADADEGVRAAALEALAAVEAPGAEATLCAALGRDASPRVRATAARALSRFGGPRVVSALAAAARGDANADVKLVAGETLRKLGAGSPTP